MTKTVKILKAMQAALLATVLTPVALHAGPALTARQMLAQAQIQGQDRVVKDRVTRINRSLVVDRAEAAKPDVPVVPPALPSPAVTASVASAPLINAETPQVDAAPLPNAEIEPAAAPAASKPSTSEIASAQTSLQPRAGEPPIVAAPAPATQIVVAAPAPATAETATSNVATSSAAAPIAASTNPSPATQPASALPAPKAATREAATTETDRASASKRIIAKDPHQSRPHAHGDAIEVGGLTIRHAGELRGQVQAIMNRPGVRAALAQYGVY
jgi:hypothetical protein